MTNLSITGNGFEADTYFFQTETNQKISLKSSSILNSLSVFQAETCIILAASIFFLYLLGNIFYYFIDFIEQVKTSRLIGSSIRRNDLWTFSRFLHSLLFSFHNIWTLVLAVGRQRFKAKSRYFTIFYSVLFFVLFSLINGMFASNTTLHQKRFQIEKIQDLFDPRAGKVHPLFEEFSLSRILYDSQDTAVGNKFHELVEKYGLKNCTAFGMDMTVADTDEIVVMAIEPLVRNLVCNVCERRKNHTTKSRIRYNYSIVRPIFKQIYVYIDSIADPEKANVADFA